jgi:assimilatory nitrate reductase catalytic subunit
MGRGVYHAALVRHGRLVASLHIAPRALLPAASWLDGLFGQARLIRHDRLALLAGIPFAGPRQEAGPMVCSCFRVGRHTIIEAIATHGLRRAEEVTALLGAGGNCGSCLPEIRELVATYGRAPIVVEQE